MNYHQITKQLIEKIDEINMDYNWNYFDEKVFIEFTRSVKFFVNT